MNELGYLCYLYLALLNILSDKTSDLKYQQYNNNVIRNCEIAKTEEHDSEMCNDVVRKICCIECVINVYAKMTVEPFYTVSLVHVVWRVSLCMKKCIMNSISS